MIVVPGNPNTVEIPIVQTGCFKSEFDSTYPIHLNGIIGQDEFQESIGNINRAISSSRKPLIIFGILAAVSLLAGVILFIVGGITATTSQKHGFPILVGIGFGLFGISIVVCVCGCTIIQFRSAVRMRQAVANESHKYSTRTPTPCSWRLHSSRYWTGGYNNRRAVTIYRIIIEIGHSGVPGSGNMSYQYNQVSPQPISFFSQSNSIVPPPPYNSYTGGGFCSHCGAPRQNAIAKFCSSCGQTLNM